jgi:hypothetical protein
MLSIQTGTLIQQPPTDDWSLIVQSEVRVAKDCCIGSRLQQVHATVPNGRVGLEEVIAALDIDPGPTPRKPGAIDHVVPIVHRET